MKREIRPHEIQIAKAASYHLFGDDGCPHGLTPILEIAIVEARRDRIVFETEMSAVLELKSRAASVIALVGGGHGQVQNMLLVEGHIYFRDNSFSGGDISLSPLSPGDASVEDLTGDAQIIEVDEID